VFELLTIVVLIWLLIHTIGLACKLTWGAAKIAAGILVVLALAALIAGLLLMGGILLLIPIGILAVAAGIMKSCLRT